MFQKKIEGNLTSIVFFTACWRFFAILLCDSVIMSSDEDPMAAVFYYPAHFVSLIALLIGGYWAALGIVVGSLVWNILYANLSVLSCALFFWIGLLGYSLIYWFFVTLYKPILKTEWQTISIQDYLVFTFLFCGCVTLYNEFVLFQIPEIDPLSLTNLFHFFLDNFFTCSFVFVVLNIIMSSYFTLLKRFHSI